MTKDILKYINSILTEAGLNYAYMRWENELLPFPYWIGEYDELESTDEDQHHEYNFRLTGTTRKAWIELENDKEKIESLFNTTTVLPNGSGVAFSYMGCLQIPTGVDDLKRVQINIKIEEWRVN